MVKPLNFETYITAVKNSVGSKIFKNVFAEVDGEKKDITENGNLSCAFFVSGILIMFKMIGEIHATVNGTIRDLQNSGWVELPLDSEPKIGSVIVWEASDFGDGKMHKHLGFFVGNGKAISNNYKEGAPAEHNLKFNGREIEKIFWNSKLEQN
jgi:hypothetical protein